MGKIVDITGQKFGKLTVLECVGKLDGRHYYWKCQCECGNVVDKLGSALRSGNTKSCGCMKFSGLQKHNLQQTQNALIPNGTKIGKLTVLEAIGYKPQYTGASKNRMWYRCKCDCGNICEVSGNKLQTNQKISCGCLSSKGELTIETILDTYGYLYNKEVILPELVQETGHKLRFDFVIYDEDNKTIKRIIEFDGRHHITGPDTNYWGHTTDTLDTIQSRDNLKNSFCLKHNYPLVRIPYTKLETLTLEDLFGDKYLIKGDD